MIGILLLSFPNCYARKRLNVQIEIEFHLCVEKVQL